MPTVSVISAWHGETGSLLVDYYRSVEGGLAEVISIDNACPPATADALREMTEHLCGVYVRNEENKGFAAANNQGYARATGDIIIFLNSDVAPLGPWLHQVIHDVREGAIYGPSLQYQLVAGRHLPYIEGWCVAATRETWEKISGEWKQMEGTEEDIARWTRIGDPWDALSYPGPYWEDNDLCFRALQAGISLIQTAWAIQHKGGQTAGPVLNHGASFAQNERTFTDRVLAAFGPLKLKPGAWTDVYARYMQHLHTPSDIQHHLPLLYSLARGNVVELGTRTGVSTAALLAGVEAHGGRVWSVDIDPCGHLYAGHPQWSFVQGDSRSAETLLNVFPIIRGEGDNIDAQIDLLLVDSEHCTEVTSAELALWEPLVRAGGYILLHDPETFPGVRRAINDYRRRRPDLQVTYVLPCNGMAVIRKLPTDKTGAPHGS